MTRHNPPRMVGRRKQLGTLTLKKRDNNQHNVYQVGALSNCAIISTEINYRVARCLGREYSCLAPVNKLVSLTWLLWALRSYRRFTLHYSAQADWRRIIGLIIGLC